MIDDLLSLKAATIERCGSRVREVYPRALLTIPADQPALDADILNSLRACQVMLDMGQRLIHREYLGAQQSAHNVLMIVPTLPRGYATRPLPRLDTMRPEFGLPRRSVGAINKLMLSPLRGWDLCFATPKTNR